MDKNDKKTSLQTLLEKGKAAGKLTTQEIDAVIMEMDVDMDGRFGAGRSEFRQRDA